MIRGMHAMFYSSDAAGARAFLRDKLGFTAHDVGEGWLIMDVDEADVGVHPTDFPGSPPSGTHSVSFYCDDIKSTVEQLKQRGVEFLSEIKDAGFGYITHFKMPGNIEVELYEPKYRKK